MSDESDVYMSDAESSVDSFDFDDEPSSKAKKSKPLGSNKNATNVKGAEKTVEERYQKKTQLEHILLRPDTYSK